MNSFDDVVARYNNTKPVISKHHKLADDIRPIAERRYKWRRIVKISDTEYGLSDGHYDDMYNHRIPQEFVRAMYPIVWTREADGDYVRIRNGEGNYAHTTRYQFIQQHTPTMMEFVMKNGKHFIAANTNPNYDAGGGYRPEYKEFRLPKTRGYRYDWGSSTVTGTDKGEFLKFKVIRRGVYERAGELIAVNNKHVDRDLKKSFKPHIDAFYNWLTIMAPMLISENGISWGDRYDMRDKIIERANSTDPRASYTILDTAHAPYVREVISNPMHEDLPLVARCLLSDMDVSSLRTLSEITTDTFRSKFVRCINNALNLYKIELV
jgi:hypothetical protein